MRPARTICFGIAATTTIVGAAWAEGDPPVARLTFERGAGAEACPDQAALESAVAARLGYVPFRPDAVRAISVRFARSGRGIAATVVATTAEGASRERTLSSATRDCEELASAVALAISVAIDPESLGREPGERVASATSPSAATSSAPAAPVPVPAPTARPAPSAAAARVPITPRPTSEASHWGVAVFPHVAIASLPSTTFGVGLAARWRHAAWVLELGARYAWPRDTDLAPGAVHSELWGGAAAACFSPGVELCGAAIASRFAASGAGVAGARSDAALTLGAGIAASYLLPLGAGLHVGPRGEAIFALRRPALVLQDQEAWRAPLVASQLGLVLGWEAP